MAENALQIIIDVVNSEAITSIDDFSAALADAFEQSGLLAKGVGSLDGAFSTITKSGLSADAMAAKLVATLKELGVQIEDEDVILPGLTENLNALGIAGSKAATGVKEASEANADLTESAVSSSRAVDKQTISMSAAEKQALIYGDVVASAEKKAVAGAYEAAAAMETMGSGYVKVGTMAELATPALMKAATWAGIGLAGLAYEGIRQYTTFQKLITQTITQAGEAPSKMGFLTNLAETVAKTTGQNLDDVANSIYRAASGTASWNNGLGATKSQLTDIVTQVSKLNVLGNISGGAESEQASRVITALINANIKGIGHNPAAAAALVNAAVGSGDMRLGDLVPGIGRGVLQSAVANNVSAKDTFAWIADLTSTGTTASVAGNYVKTGINLLANPSAQGTDVLSMIGIKPGEMGNIMSSPGGLVSAAKTLKQAINQLNPSSVAGYFFNTTGQVRAGGSGLQGAIDKLQTMSANSLSPKFISDWMSGKLDGAEKQQAFSLILDKAYGGSKQFATIASILNNPSLLQNIESHINAENNTAYLKRSEARAEATPAQQFKRMEQSLLVNLVNIGHTLTPVALTFAHIITGVVGGLSKFKVVIDSFIGMAVGLLGFAGISKMASLAHGMAPYFGMGYNRLGHTRLSETAFGKGMLGRANSAEGPFGFRLLNIYDAKKHGVMAKMGGESISAGYLPTDTSKFSAEGKAIYGNGTKQVDLLESINKNTAVSATVAEKGGASFGGGGGSGVGGGGGLSAAEKDAGVMTQRTEMLALGPGSAENGTLGYVHRYGDGAIPLSTRTDQVIDDMAYYQHPISGQWRVRPTVSETPPGSAVPRDATYIAQSQDARIGTTAEAIASRGASADALLASSGLGDVAGTAATVGAESVGGGMLAGLGETLGGIAGGPIGMMGMMMAPMMIGALTPALGKLGSLLGNLFSGGKQSVYTPVIHGPDTVGDASARQAKALKRLQAYWAKNSTGKYYQGANGQWAVNPAAKLADPIGYMNAQEAYAKATGTYNGVLGNQKKYLDPALKAVYGKDFNNDLQWAKSMSKAGELEQIAGFVKINQMVPQSLRAQWNALTMHKGPNTPGTTLQSYQDLTKLLTAYQAKSKGILGAFSQGSAQDQGKYFPALAAMNTNGFDSIQNSLNTNMYNEAKVLREKGATLAKSSRFLPMYAAQDQLIINKDKAALSQNLPPEARVYFQQQKAEAEASLKGTNDLIEKVRNLSENTKLAGESVDKLAKETGTQVANSALPDNIANALARVLNPYIKTSKSQGTSSNATRTNPSVKVHG